jgi:hypothetical protein
MFVNLPLNVAHIQENAITYCSHSGELIQINVEKIHKLWRSGNNICHEIGQFLLLVYRGFLGVIYPENCDNTFNFFLISRVYLVS